MLPSGADRGHYRSPARVEHGRRDEVGSQPRQLGQPGHLTSLVALLKPGVVDPEMG